jgi:hypothetical protein
VSTAPMPPSLADCDRGPSSACASPAPRCRLWIRTRHRRLRHRPLRHRRSRRC